MDQPDAWSNVCVCVCVLQRRKINDCSNNIMMISQETKSSQTLSLTQTRSDEQPGQSETQNGNDSSCKQAFYNDGKALSLVHTHTHTESGALTLALVWACVQMSACTHHLSLSLSAILSIIKTWGLCHRRFFHVFFSPFIFFVNFSHYQSLSSLFSFFLAFSFLWLCNKFIGYFKFKPGLFVTFNQILDV